MPYRGLYVLDGHEPVIADDLIEWSRWFTTADRGVASTDVGEARVSTVFTGIDHAWSNGPPGGPAGNPPVLFETLIFGGAHGGEGGRCCTWVEAEAMHARFVELLLRGELH